MKRPTWRIEKLRHTHAGKVSRVTALVNGSPVWFESEDIDLYPAAEAFATLFFIPALEAQASLSIDAELHPDWLDRTRKLLPIYADWWGYPEDHPISRASQKAPSVTSTSFPTSTSKAGQCFTGGVDSFHTLLNDRHDASHLFFVQGYDIPTSDARRMEAFSHTLQAVAAAFDKEIVRLRTNVRTHDDFAEANWNRTHGAALAAAGHLASGTFGRLVIPSSYAYTDEIPWGSHWDTDPLWSLPGRLEVIHDDASRTRRDKLLHIAGASVVQQHLRVCWENRAATGNCSQCEKCLRTMVLLEASGTLKHYQVFDTHTPLSDRIDDTPSLREHLWFVWEDMAQRPAVKPDTSEAIQRLLRRSRKAEKKEGAWAYRQARKIWKRMKAFLGVSVP